MLYKIKLIVVTLSLAILAAIGRGGERDMAVGYVDYAPPERLADLESDEILESSGIAVSHRREGVFWTHNDSGDTARIFAFDSLGRSRGVFKLAGSDAVDWEDMASFTMDNRHYLLLADVGDNALRRKQVTIYVISEPDDRQPDAVRVIRFEYDGGPQNVEAVAVDVTLRQIILINKILTTHCKVFAMSLPDRSPEKPLRARQIATLPIPLVTAMDISPDGRRAIVMTYNYAEQFVRLSGEDWPAAFARPSRRVVTPKLLQGESICYGADGATLFLTSEKQPTPLWRLSPVKPLIHHPSPITPAP